MNKLLNNITTRVHKSQTDNLKHGSLRKLPIRHLISTHCLVEETCFVPSYNPKWQSVNVREGALYSRISP